jgi:hypothetical protein
MGHACCLDAITVDDVLAVVGKRVTLRGEG